MARALHAARLLADTATQENDDSYTLTLTGESPISIPAAYLDYDSGDGSNKPILKMASGSTNDGSIGKWKKRVWGWFWGIFT